MFAVQQKIAYTFEVVSNLHLLMHEKTLCSMKTSALVDQRTSDAWLQKFDHPLHNVKFVSISMELLL